jgi:hypothetical protein
MSDIERIQIFIAWYAMKFAIGYIASGNFSLEEQLKELSGADYVGYGRAGWLDRFLEPILSRNFLYRALLGPSPRL